MKLVGLKRSGLKGSGSVVASWGRALGGACLMAMAVGLVVTGCQQSSAPVEATPTVSSRAATNSATVDASTSDASASEQVRAIAAADLNLEGVELGSDTLVRGIPGKGALTLEEIEAWLARDEVHEVIAPKLPIGMLLGEREITGLEENPLTLAKIELGRQLYFDTRLSKDTSLSCASCHDPNLGYASDTRFGIGIEKQEGNRNSPVAYNRILSAEQFWDGRAGSLEEQAIGPIANPIEMGNTHEACTECLQGIAGYRLQFERLFEEGITIENVGKALASFERAIVTGASPWDHYERLASFQETYADDLADLALLEEEDPELYAEYRALEQAVEEHRIGEEAIRGGKLFFDDRSNCSACHNGANFTDELYHNIGVGMDADEPDLGRYVVTKDDADRGAFKTPTLRNVAQTAPYMHDGSQQTLAEVIAWYNQGGHANEHLSTEIQPLNLTDQEQADLVAFLKALTGRLPKVESRRLPE